MKLIKRKLIPCLLALVLCMGVLATPTFAYAEEDDGTDAVTETPVEETEAGEEEALDPLTPEGNLTLVDDIGSDTGSGKQFITVSTKSGNYFYLIIDRDDEGESTVHFLNQVDEADLLSLMDEDEAAEYAASLVETEEPEKSVEEATVTEEPDTSEEAEPEEEQDDSGQSTNMLPAAVLLLVLIGGGAAFLYQQLKKKKQTAQEKPDPDADYLEDGDDAFDLPEDGEHDADETGEDGFDDSPDDEPV